jgi:tRNA G18 (ribose-2'-O)-methylase SpoU
MGDAIPVEDPHDPRLVDYMALAEPAARRRQELHELFIAEGVTAIERLLDSDHTVRSILVTPQTHTRLAPRLAASSAPVYVAPRSVLARTVGFQLHRGAVAAAERRPLPAVADVVSAARRMAVLEGLNDPENVGAIARSARALGIDALVLDPTCIDPYYRRTIRVSMGEVLHVRVARAAAWPDDLDRLRAAGIEMWALTPDVAADDLFATDVPCCSAPSAKD